MPLPLKGYHMAGNCQIPAVPTGRLVLLEFSFAYSLGAQSVVDGWRVGWMWLTAYPRCKSWCLNNWQWRVLLGSVLKPGWPHDGMKGCREPTPQKQWLVVISIVTWLYLGQIPYKYLRCFLGLSNFVPYISPKKKSPRLGISPQYLGCCFSYLFFTLPETNIAHENPHLSW